MLLKHEACLTKITRSMGLLPGARRLTEKLRQSSRRKYKNNENANVIIEDYDGNLKFQIDRSTHMGSLVYWSGYHSRNELALLHKLLKPTMVFADVGANVGEFTVYAAKRLSSGKVLAFEPIEFIYETLADNVYRNAFDNVMLFNFGLFDKAGQSEMFGSPDALKQTFLEGWGTAFKDPDLIHAGQSTMAVFDDLVKELHLKRLDIMKIDVEGAELNVLHGSKNSLEKFHPILIMEINEFTFHRAGYSSKHIFDFLSTLGYAYYLIKRFGKLAPLNRSRLPKAVCYNILCKPTVG